MVAVSSGVVVLQDNNGLWGAICDMHGWVGGLGMGKAGASDPDPVWFGKSFSKEAEVESKCTELQ